MPEDEKKIEEQTNADNDIDAAVKDIAAEIDESAKKAEGKEDPEPQEEVEEEQEEQKEEPPKGDEKKDEPPAVSDELRERAVRAGLSMKEVEKINDPELLEDIVKRISPPKKEEAKAKDEGGDETPSDIALPDIKLNEWDEDVGPVLKQYNDVIDKQQKTIKELSARIDGVDAEGKKIARQTWLDAQYGGLGDGYKDSLGVGQTPTAAQAANRKAVEDKFSLLQAGYKATGTEMPDDKVFREAVTLVAGNAKPAAPRKHIASVARPSHVTPSGKKKEANDEESILEEIAADITREFNL